MYIALSIFWRFFCLFETSKMIFPPKGLCKADTEGGPIVFTYRGFQPKSPPPLWKKSELQGGTNCVTGDLWPNRAKKGGGDLG